MSIYTLKSGAELDVIDNGIESNAAIFFHHGTPGHSSAWSNWISELASVGVRGIAASRPGYGESSRQIGRKVKDIAQHVSEISDSYSIEKYVSIGWSGGGPHALATTLDPRCVGVITLAGVGQYGKPDLDFLAGMGPENIDEFGVALRGEEPLRTWMAENAGVMQSVSGDDVREAFGGLIGVADKAVLEGIFADELASAMRSGLKSGFDGWIDDDLAFIEDWGFDLGAIHVPVQVWQGDDDFMVPHVHSQWLARKIPTASLNFTRGEGHLSLLVKERHQIVTQSLHLLDKK